VQFETVGSCSVARRLREYTFIRQGVTKYPWDEWLDGSIWVVVHGKDFQCAPGSLVVYLYHKASSKGLSVRTSILRGKRRKPDRVVFQFSKRTDSEPVVEKKYRKLKRRQD
jgi:hypothetical protein